MNGNDEKKLIEAMTKVRAGKAVFVKNISGCKVDMDAVKLYRLKNGEELLVDKELDVNLLDKMNANKNIKVETVCSGHTGEFPTVGFNYKGKRSIVEIKRILTNIPDIDFTYDSQIVKRAVPLKNGFKIKRGREEYTLCGIESELQDYFFIRGTKKGNKIWWNNVSRILSKLR